MRFEFWIRMGVMLLMEALHDAVKSDANRKKFRESFLTAHKSLKAADESVCAAYAGDPDFA